MKVFVGSADHEHQCAGCCSDDTARYRRVDEPSVGGRGHGVQFLGEFHTDGRGIDEDGVLGCLREQSAWAEQHFAHVVTGGQHRDDRVGAGGGLDAR